MKIGVLGGTFNPIHMGHLMLGEAVKAALGLDEIWFIPAGRTPLKENNFVLSAERRVEMVRRAISPIPYFRLSTVEIDRPGISYTVDTVRELRQKLSSEDELYLIIGWDSLAQLPQWKDPVQIIQNCRLVAAPRPGYTLPDLQALETAIPGLSDRLKIMEYPEIDISSTEIRERVATGADISNLVPLEVGRYIKEHGLYRSNEEGGRAGK